jgi:hypothetical protein
MDIPHPERHRWVKVISSINKKINETQGAAAGAKKPTAPKPQPPMRMGMGGVHWVAPDDDDD